MNFVFKVKNIVNFKINNKLDKRDYDNKLFVNRKYFKNFGVIVN